MNQDGSSALVINNKPKNQYRRRLLIVGSHTQTPTSVVSLAGCHQSQMFSRLSWKNIAKNGIKSMKNKTNLTVQEWEARELQRSSPAGWPNRKSAPPCNLLIFRAWLTPARRTQRQETSRWITYKRAERKEDIQVGKLQESREKRRHSGG